MIAFGTAMAEQVPLSSNASALQPALDAERDDKTHEVVPDVAYCRLGIVNVVFFGPSKAGDRGLGTDRCGPARHEGPDQERGR